MRFVVALGAIAVLARPLAAQSAPSPVGVAVRVDTEGRQGVLRGTVIQLDKDSLRIWSDAGKQVNVGWDNIRRAEYRAGRQAGDRYAAIGAIVGGLTLGLASAAVTTCTGSSECRNRQAGGVVAIGAFVGAAAGAGVGFALRPAHWLELLRPTGESR
jgi:hypothetical protein